MSLKRIPWPVILPALIVGLPLLFLNEPLLVKVVAGLAVIIPASALTLYLTSRKDLNWPRR
jgi:hypothetical protein